MADTKRFSSGSGAAGAELKDFRLRLTTRKPNEPQGTSINAAPSTTAIKSGSNVVSAAPTNNTHPPVSTPTPTSPASKPSPAPTSPPTTTKPELKPVTTNSTMSANRPTATSATATPPTVPPPMTFASPTAAPSVAPSPSAQRPENVSNVAEHSMRKTEFYEEEVQHFAEVDVKSFSIPPRPSEPPSNRLESDELRCRSKPKSAAKPTPKTSKSSSVNLIYVLLTLVLAAAIGWLGYEEILPTVYVVPGIAISVGILVMLLVWSVLF